MCLIFSVTMQERVINLYILLESVIWPAIHPQSVVSYLAPSSMWETIA